MYKTVKAYSVEHKNILKLSVIIRTFTMCMIGTITVRYIDDKCVVSSFVLYKKMSGARVHLMDGSVRPGPGPGHWSLTVCQADLAGR